MRKSRYKKGELDILGGFVALPRDVFASQDYKSLSIEAMALLLAILEQYRGNNNGDLTPSYYVVGKTLGWGRTRHAKAVSELRGSRLVQVTAYPRVGTNGRPELWALSWFGLDFHRKMDIEPKEFKRFLYRDLPTANPNAKQDERALRLIKTSLKAAGKIV